MSFSCPKGQNISVSFILSTCDTALLKRLCTRVFLIYISGEIEHALTPLGLMIQPSQEASIHLLRVNPMCAEC